VPQTHRPPPSTFNSRGILSKIRNRDIPLTPETLTQYIYSLQGVEKPLFALLSVTQNDIKSLKDILPTRKAQLADLAKSPQPALSIEPERLNPATLDIKLEKFTERAAQQAKDLTAAGDGLKALISEIQNTNFERALYFNRPRKPPLHFLLGIPQPDRDPSGNGSSAGSRIIRGKSLGNGETIVSIG